VEPTTVSSTYQHDLEIAPDEPETVPFVTVDGNEFDLAQFHFHNPSENTVNSNPSTMEIHFVNKNAAGAVSVVAVFLQLGAHNNALDPILNTASTLPAPTPSNPTSETTLSDPVNLVGLLPASMQGWYFQGSLTSSPYSLPINWFVLATPITLDATQLAEYQAVANAGSYLPNARAVQPLDGRQLNEIDNYVNFQGQQITGVNFTLRPVNAPIIATGADAGGGPEVKVFDATTGALRLDFFAYASNFTGGVRVALGDVNADGVPDIITAPGPGGGPQINVYDGSTGQLIRSFFAFNPSFAGGAYVAAGDVDADGADDVIVGADAGGGPNVIVFVDSSITGGGPIEQLYNFMAFNTSFTGGVRVAAGDVNGDGFADIICGAGPGGGPNVTVFSGATGQAIQSFFAYNAAFAGGVYVASADVNGDGNADIIVGAGAGGGPNVTVFSGLDNSVLASYIVFDPAFTGGVRVGGWQAVAGLSGGVVAGAGPGGGPIVRAVDPLSGAPVDQFFAYDPTFAGGIFVAGAR
jgi:carbonic anhydrase